MHKYKIVLSVSYLITADEENDAINKAFEQLTDEIYGQIDSDITGNLEHILGSNAELIEESQ